MQWERESYLTTSFSKISIIFLFWMLIMVCYALIKQKIRFVIHLIGLFCGSSSQQNCVSGINLISCPVCNFHATFAKDKLSVSLSSISFSWSWKQNLCKFFRKLVFNSLCSMCLSHKWHTNVIVVVCSSCLMCQFIFIMSRALCTFDLNIKRSSFFIGPSQLPILCTSCDATYYKTLQLFLS